MLISVYPNGYSVAVLERNRTVNVPKMDSNPRKFRLKPNKGIIFETLRNYTHPGVAQLKILKGGNSPITLDLRIQYLKTETASQLSVKQDSSIQRLTEGINDAAAFMGYASQSHSTIVLSG